MERNCVLVSDFHLMFEAAFVLHDFVVSTLLPDHKCQMLTPIYVTR